MVNYLFGKEVSVVRFYLGAPTYGSVAERIIALVLKTSDRNRSVGSNPTTSANFVLTGGCYDIAKRKVSKKYKKTCNEVYKYFSRHWSHICDYSDESMLEMFLYETFGEGYPKSNNGFFLGKKWMDINLKMWFEDIPEGYTLPTCFKNELYDDPDLPNWWLDKVLKNR